MRPASAVHALQLMPPEGEREASDARTRVRDLPHLSTERIEDAMRRCAGNLTRAAEALNVARSSLYRRVNAEPSLLATRDEIVESFIDTAEGVIVAALARGDVNAATFVLRTQGHRRGWSTLAARQEAEQTPESPRPRVDMTAALKALSPAELMQLEAIVGKLEANAKSGAGLDAGTTRARADLSDAGTFPGRGLRIVDEVEAVVAPDEVEPSAEANLSTTDKLNPGDITKPE